MSSSKDNFYIRIGDVVYMQHKSELRDKHGNVEVMKGILNGDGIANNRLLCISKDFKKRKNAFFHFKRSLFRIEPAGKFFYQSAYHSYLNQVIESGNMTLEIKKNLIILKGKYDEEIKDNEQDFEKSRGHPISYGQTIHLKHIYSGSYLSYDEGSLAKQAGCIQMILHPESSERALFKFVSEGNLKGPSDLVCYSDNLNIASGKGEYFLHIYEEKHKSLEANGSELHTHWKILRYMDRADAMLFDSNNDFLESGDVVRIHHKSSGKVIGTESFDIENAVTEKKIFCTVELEEICENSHPTTTFNIDLEKIDNPSAILKERDETTTSDLWEIQRLDTFTGGFMMRSEKFRLKNVATNLFLYVDPTNPEIIQLTAQGDLSGCYFQMLARKHDIEGRVEYEDTLSIKCVESSKFLQDLIDPQDPRSFVGPKSLNTIQMEYFFEYSDDKYTLTGNRMTSIYDNLLDFYIFLQDWAVSKKNIVHGHVRLEYSYEKAFDSEKQLEIESDQLKECLENLERFLKYEKNFSQSVKQKILRERRIIKLLLLVNDLIDKKIYTGINTDEIESDEGPYIRLKSTRKKLTQEEWRLLDKSPNVMAKKYLERFPKKIFDIVIVATKHDPESSADLLFYDKFFISMMTEYQQEAFSLYREAIKNSFRLNEYDYRGLRVFDLIDLLEPINETDENIKFQINIINLLGLACLDSNYEGASFYQDFAIDKLTNSESYFLKKILHFYKDHDNLLVVFGRYEEREAERFLFENHSLNSNNGITHVRVEKTNEFYYSLKDISQSESSAIDLIMDYICSVLNLFASLCKGRNSKAKNYLNNLGLKELYLRDAIQNELIHTKMRRFFILIYQNLYIDVDPLSPIDQTTDLCFVWEELHLKRPLKSTYLWHKSSFQIKKNEEHYNLEYVEFLNAYLKDFWTQGRIVSERYPFGIQYHDKEDKEIKCGYLISMLEMTKSCVAFGYTEFETNRIISHSIVHLLYMFDEGKNSLDQYHWAAAFCHTDDYRPLRHLFDVIYKKVGEILDIMSTIRLNLQVLMLLKIYHLCFATQKTIDKKSMEIIYEEICKVYSLNIPIDATQQEYKDKFMIQAESLDEKERRELSKIVGEVLVNDEKVISSSFVLKKTMLEHHHARPEFLERVKIILKDYYNQRQILYNGLCRAEFLVGKKETDLFIMFSQLKSIENDIQIYLQEEENIHRKNDQQLSAKKEFIINKINKINHHFKQKKKDFNIITKSQNMLRNLGIISSILSIFRVKYKESHHYNLFKCIINLLAFFCKNNNLNQDLLLPYTDDFLHLISDNLKTAKLLAFIYSDSKTKDEGPNLIEKIFKDLDKKSIDENVREHFLILRNLIVDKYKHPIKENQRKIISRLMKNRNFLSTVEFRFTKKLLHPENEFQAMKKKTEFQCESILLLGNLAYDSKLGIFQAQKVISLDRIRTILMNEDTPYLQKKCFLRCLYQIYISKFDALNADFSRSDLIEILTDIVLPDLKLFEKYIPGIIGSRFDQGEKKKFNHQMRRRIISYRITLAKPDKNNKGFTEDFFSTSENNPRILEDISEYWEFICSGKHYDVGQDGILYFIVDCLNEIKKRKWDIDQNLAEILTNIRLCLLRMNETIFKVEDEINRDGIKMSFAKYTSVINEIIDSFNFEKMSRIGKNYHFMSDGLFANEIEDKFNVDEEVKLEDEKGKLRKEEEFKNIISSMMSRIKRFMLNRRIRLEEFQLMFENTDEKINVDDFSKKLKRIFGKSITDGNIAEFLSLFNRKDPNEIRVNKFFMRIKKSLERDRAMNFSEMYKEEHEQVKEENAGPSPWQISQGLIKFVSGVKLLVENEEFLDKELIKISQNVSKHVISLPEVNYIEFLQSEINNFQDEGYILYLLKALKFILKHHLELLDAKYSTEDMTKIEENKKNENVDIDFSSIQQIYCKAKVLEFCIGLVKKESSKHVVLEALNIIIYLLRGGNRNGQIIALETLIADCKKQSFLGFIKYQLRETHEEYENLKEFYESTGAMSLVEKEGVGFKDEFFRLNVDITAKILKVIQSFGDNCFLDFQNFMRTQRIPNVEVASLNIVTEIASFIVNLSHSDRRIFENVQMLPLVEAALDTLVDMCLGPCRENQILLCRLKPFVSFLNIFLEKKFDFATVNKKEFRGIETLSKILDIILAMITSNHDEVSLSEFVEQLNLSTIIETLKLIYRKKIGNRKKYIFRRELKCHHKSTGPKNIVTCGFNFCEQSYLTPEDDTVVDVGFKIFIILQYLKENYKENEILNSFNMIPLTEDEEDEFEIVKDKYKEVKRARIEAAKPKVDNSGKKAQAKKVKPGTVMPQDAPKSPSNVVDDSKIKFFKKKDANSNIVAQTAFVNKVKNNGPVQQPSNIFGINLAQLQDDDDHDKFPRYFELLHKKEICKLYKFFKRFVNNVEISQDGVLTKLYFKIPYECDFITQNINEDLIYKANRNSDTERLEHLFYCFPLYWEELVYRQRISNHTFIEFFVKSWRFLKDFSYIMICIYTIFNLALADIDSDGTIIYNNISSTQFTAITLFFSTIQIAALSIVYIFCMIERYPISLYKDNSKKEGSNALKLELKGQNAVERNTKTFVSLLKEFSANFKSDKEEIDTRLAKVLRILFDPENLYNLIYLIISIVAFATTPLVYSILLLDIVKRSTELQNIIRSVTDNGLGLIKVLVLGIITILLLAVIIFIRFNEQIDGKCDSLLNCLTYGFGAIKTGGGIGDVMTAQDLSSPDNNYFSRYAYDFAYFIIIIIIWKNIISGIIVDSFGDLRDSRKEEIIDIEEKCFICSQNRLTFDRKGNGWFEHIYEEHNVYAYMNLLIYISKKDSIDCNGTEKYVKNMIKMKNIEFIPQTAICLETSEDA